MSDHRADAAVAGGLLATVAAIDGMPRRDLLELQYRVVRLRREADVALARIAAEIARRSTPDDGAGGLARREGHTSAGRLIAGATGGSVAEAERLIHVGSLLAGDSPNVTSGSPAERGSGVPGSGAPYARYSFAVIAEAVRLGELSIDAASVITSALEQHPTYLNSDQLDDEADAAAVTGLRELEARMVAKAKHLPLAQVRKLAWRVQALANPRAWEEREERLREERSVTWRDESDGMVTMTARLDPVTAAPVKAFMDGYVRQGFQARRDQGRAGADVRTAWQMRADALGWLATHATSCEASHGGVKTTIVVRMSLSELRSGSGVAEIDGMSQPVSATRARSMAADSEVVPAVLGDAGEVLAWGRKRRLFTPAQRLALVERDGGCSWCHAPPSHCDAHHVKWWDRDAGPTDLANGVLLCVSCHHRVHRDGWDIDVRDNEVWFTPPRAVDPQRTPRRGGRARIEVPLAA